MKKKRLKKVLQGQRGRNGLSVLKYAAAFAMVVGMLSGCGVKKPEPDEPKSVNEPVKNDAKGTQQDAPDGAEIKEDTETERRRIQSFTAQAAEVIPQVKQYDFASAKEFGDVQQIRGMLPGADEGIWYIISVDGVEYYYGAYGTEDADGAECFGYAILSERYTLQNGITVGMTVEEVLEEYPDMAVVDFEGNMLSRGITGTQGWNGTAYPRSYLGMDEEWPYDGKDYKWSDQFDCAMLADVDMGTEDVLPASAALLVKDGRVAAITFFHPTAG